MTSTTTPPANSASRFFEALPVAQLFEFHRTENIGSEVLVTVVVGDAEHAPRTHGLRAPLRRWAQIVAALYANPLFAAEVAQAIEHPSHGPSRMRLPSPPIVVERAPVATGGGEIPPAADPASPFFRKPVLKPSGDVL